MKQSKSVVVILLEANNYTCKRTMNDIIKQSFNINIFVMETLGLYPCEKHSNFRQVQAYVMYILFIIMVPFLTILNFIVEENLDILQLNNTATFLSETICWIIKLLPFLVNGQRIKKCINYFGDSYFTTLLCGDTDRKNIINNCIQVCRRNSLIFLTGVIGGLASFIIKPLFLNNQRLPLNMWLPFRTSENWIYIAVYLFLAIGIV
jgi:hypothetical protein